MSTAQKKLQDFINSISILSFTARHKEWTKQLSQMEENVYLFLYEPFFIIIF